MSLARLWAVLAVALPVLAAILAPMSTVDLAYQLRAGDEILGARAIPDADTWTFSVAGQAWFDQQWGAQVLLATVHDAAGWTGLVLLRAALTGLAFGALYAAVRARGVGTRVAALLTMAAFLLASPSLALRPQLFGVALFGATLWALEGRRTGAWTPWLVPLLAIAWANTHGSFVLAPLAVGWALLEDLVAREQRARRMALVTALTVAGTAITPWGPGVWAYAAGLSTNASLATRVTEWQPPGLDDPAGIAFLASGVVVAAMVAAAWRRGRRLSWPSIAWMAGLFMLGLRAVRGLAWWPIGAAAALAPLVAEGERERAPVPARDATPPGMRRVNIVLVALLVVAGVALLPSWRPTDAAGMPDGVLRDAPAGVVVALRREAADGDRVFHPQRWGSWLEYATPAIRTFVDSRIELFADAVWADYDAIASAAPGWEGRLASLAVRFAVVAPDDAALEARIRAAGWTEVYAGADGFVFAAPGSEAATGPS